MNKRYPAMLIAGAAGIGSLLLPMSVAPASASSVCRVEVTKITNVDLQDNDSTDEIKFELGDNTYGKFDFTTGQIRTNSLGHPSESTTFSSVHFELWDVDSIVKTTIGTRSLSCVDGDHWVTLNNNGGEYIVYYSTTH